MKTTLLVILFLPFIALSQDELIVKGKMIYGDTKTATVQIIEKENPSDTITVQIDKKKFRLEPLDITKSYELIFTCGDWSKKINLEKQTKETKSITVFYVEIDWRH